MWQFWIDVGGTFTDCLARPPGGSLLRHKVLSSGVVKGRAGPGSTCHLLVDPDRASDPPGFWVGSELRVLDRRGRPIHRTIVAGERPGVAGSCELETPAPDTLEGCAFELDAGWDAPVLAMRYLMELGPAASLPPVNLRLGTTRGTNALLTRSGARVALLTTRGFGDLLAIGNQDRPDLFALDIRKPEPLYAEVVEVRQRVGADGSVIEQLDAGQLEEDLTAARSRGIESLAVCLLHADRFPSDERAVGELAAAAGFQQVRLSHEVAPLIKAVPRADTTTLDAYLSPVLQGYVGKLGQALPGSAIRLMTSSGGLVGTGDFRGKDSILSGPAGGVVGYARVAKAAGLDEALGFDMGGTSTDVSRYAGRFELEYETTKAGVRIVAPTLAIETVAAGGGSWCRFDGVKLTVGPDSAGSDPGPACYGRGGPLTVTDMNVYLGRVPADRFPFPLDRTTVEQQLREQRDAIERAGGPRYSPAVLATGYLRVANTNMAQAIRSISIARGFDPRRHALIAFGGAAPQHVCAVADELNITRALVPDDAGILSARGIGLADLVRHRVSGIYRPLAPPVLHEAGALATSLERELVAELAGDGLRADQIEVARELELRYQGTDASLVVAWELGRERDHFEEAHRRLYGYVQDDRPVELVALRLEARGGLAEPLPASARLPADTPAPARRLVVLAGDERLDAAGFSGEELLPGATIHGPAVVSERHSTLVVDPGWTAAKLSQGDWLLERDQPTTTGERVVAAVGGPTEEARFDPIHLEVFHRHFGAIARQMGITLQNTSSSVNVKERLDFSCALFTAAGDLVVNAPHIPVHLGSMSETVKSILRANRDLHPGDSYVTNDPFQGGSHLPDITVVTPVFASDDGGPLLFFTASRAHHAEIGGTRPGSMPPNATSLAEEGVLIRNFLLLSRGVSRHAELRRLLQDAPFPSRAVDDNLADIRAQLAANRQGARDLRDMMHRFGQDTVLHYMQGIQEAAERKTRAALRRLGDGTFEFQDHLDDGTPIQVRLEVHDGNLIVDFQGSGGTRPNNLNANPAIVTAALMYSLRCLLDEDIPLNQGVLSPVRLKIPPGLLCPEAHEDPTQCPAVAGGNVETSQRVVDVLLGALQLAAASQGTMNNVLFGSERFGYYETICGGAGATPRADGADAVHTHMTNTRITDPEILEYRYPVRLLEFSIRRGSGGAGKRRGGDGVVRRLQFLERLDVSLLTQRRGPFAPYGMDGGGAGAPGSNRLERSDGRVETLGAVAETQVEAGDILVIETPGGGGWGRQDTT